MTFKDFKTSLQAELIGDVSIPDDALLKSLIHKHLKGVGEFCEPLSLQTDDLDFDVLKILNNNEFIRVPEVPQNEGDDIGIDEKLCDAVVLLVASNISRNKKDQLLKDAKKIMMDYVWNIYETCEDEDEH